MGLHRSAQGKMVDMTKLAQQNEMTVAVGNVKVNARGDRLGPNGEIMIKREEAAAQYYKIPSKAEQAALADAPVITEEIPVEAAVKSASSAPKLVAPTTKDSQ